MGMATKSLDRYMRPLPADCVVDDSKGRTARCGPDRIMSENDEEINRLGVIDRITKPALLDQIPGLDDLGHIGITGEIKKDSESHDSQPCEN